MLKLKFRHVWWSIAGQPDFPPRDFKSSEYEGLYGAPHRPRSYDMIHLYLSGRDAHYIAQRYNVTRERVRQILWKGYRGWAAKAVT